MRIKPRSPDPQADLCSETSHQLCVTTGGTRREQLLGDRGGALWCWAVTVPIRKRDRKYGNQQYRPWEEMSPKHRFTERLHLGNTLGAVGREGMRRE